MFVADNLPFFSFQYVPLDFSIFLKLSQKKPKTRKVSIPGQARQLNARRQSAMLTMNPANLSVGGFLKTTSAVAKFKRS